MTTVDGTAQVVTITITGSNDAAIITGDRDRRGRRGWRGGWHSDGDGRPAGDRRGQRGGRVPGGCAGAATTNGYGTYGVTAAGVWTYTLDNTNAAVNALNELSPPLSDTFTVLSEDGTAAAGDDHHHRDQRRGDHHRHRDRRGRRGWRGAAGTPTATGDLLATDVDNAADAFQAVAPGAATTNGYGTYGVTAAGVWTYTLDNTNAAVNALNELSPPLSDSSRFCQRTARRQLVTITITGSNDAAIITGTATGAVDEAGAWWHAGHADGDGRSAGDRRGQRGGRVPGGCAGCGDHQRLRHLRGDGGGGVDLHAGQHQCGGQCAQRRARR